MKYPENLRLRKALKRGEVAKLAAKAGVCRGTIYEVLSGRRRATMDFQEAFLELMREKKELARQVNEVVGNE